MKADANVVVGRAWRDGVLYQEVAVARSGDGLLMGPFEFNWVFEVVTERGSDRIDVPAGVPMTWMPLL